MRASEDPEPVRVTDPTLCQAADPPPTAGVLGATASIRTVPAAAPGAGAQEERLPPPSTERNCTRVSPSADTVTSSPAAGVLHVSPPSAEVRCSYPVIPNPPASSTPAALRVTGPRRQASEPPATAGADGATGSVRCSGASRVKSLPGAWLTASARSHATERTTFDRRSSSSTPGRWSMPPFQAPTSFTPDGGPTGPVSVAVSSSPSRWTKVFWPVTAAEWLAETRWSLGAMIRVGPT